MRKINPLKRTQDAYGQSIWAYHIGRKSFEVVERDDGDFDATATRLYFSEFDDWAPHEKKAMEFVKGRVLDVGCGAGRHSLYLQKKGFDVLGIDSSPLAIKVCKLRGLKKTKVMSIEDLAFQQGSFETILMLGGNFGLFGSFTKARRLLRKFHEITSKNALILAETVDVYRADSPEFRRYMKSNEKRGRFGGQIRIRVRFHKYVTEWFDYLYVSREEMEEILKGTGWKVNEYLDSSGLPYIAVIGKTA